MKTIRFDKTVDIGTLYAEILRAYPALRGTIIQHENLLDEEGAVREVVANEQARLSVFSTGVTVPDNADESQLLAIIDAHNPNTAVKPVARKSLAERLSDALDQPISSLAQLKAALKAAVNE